MLLVCEVMSSEDIFSANVPDEESPLASGMAPAREAESAGGMPEVPEGRGFAPSVCSISSFYRSTLIVHQREPQNQPSRGMVSQSHGDILIGWHGAFKKSFQTGEANRIESRLAAP